MPLQFLERASNLKKSKWIVYYYLLSAICVITVLLSVFLNYQAFSLFENSLDNYISSTTNLDNYMVLEELFSKLDKPANNIFNSKNVEREWKELNDAKNQLNIQFSKLRKESKYRGHSKFLKYLDSMEILSQRMARETEDTLNAFKQKRYVEAGNAMAQVDSNLSLISTEMRILEKIVDKENRQEFFKNRQQGDILRYVGCALAVLVLLMISGICWYGRILSRRFQASAQLQEELFFALAYRSEKLEQSFKELEDIKQAIDESSIVAITDEKGIITYVNDKFCTVSGYSREEVIGKTHCIVNSGYHSKEFFENMWQTISSGQIWRAEIKNKNKQGGYYWVDSTLVPLLGDDGKPNRYIAIRHETTMQHTGQDELDCANELLTQLNKELENQLEYRTQMESKLVHTQKMEALGTLAGGIAHDFNNLLWMIMGNSELMLEKLDENETEKIPSNLNDKNEELREIQLSIHAATNRAKGLVQQLLDFSRQKDDTEKVMVPVQELIREVANMVRNILPSTIELKLSINPTEQRVLASPDKLHQILMNLCTNAYHAMGETGTLVIGLQELYLDIDSLEYFPGDAHERHYLVIEVSDTGSGMTPAVMKKIFDPFFTTKEVGKGTGLGLSTVHGLVQEIGGVIHVYSEPGQGTTFHIYLPSVQPSDKPMQLTEKRSSVVDPFQRVSKRIMVVDDEPMIRQMVTKMLTRLEHEVETFPNGEEAFEAFKRHPEYYDLIITDQTMPKLSGIELARKILEICPRQPIILATGYSRVLTEEEMQNVAVTKIMNKPFHLKELATTIDELLSVKTPSNVC